MSGVVNSTTLTLDANGRSILNNANFLFIISASLPIQVQLTRMLKDAGSETFSSVQAGLQIGRVRQWDQCVLTGTAGATVTLYYGFQQVREDYTNFQQQIATIAGTVAIASLPANTLADTAQVVCPNGAQTAVVPANLARRRVTLSIVSGAATASLVFLRKTGGANNLLELQAGVFYTFEGTYGLDVRNDSGGALNVMVMEES